MGAPPKPVCRGVGLVRESEAWGSRRPPCGREHEEENGRGETEAQAIIRSGSGGGSSKETGGQGRDTPGLVWGLISINPGRLPGGGGLFQRSEHTGIWRDEGAWG